MAPPTALQAPVSVPTALHAQSRGTKAIIGGSTPALSRQPVGSGWQHRRRPQQLGWRQTARQPLHTCSSYKSNPQNVEQCQVPPAPEYSAEEAVRIQLEALQRNDEPWGNHGVQTAYEWAFDVGGLDPSLYFGFPKDLYHFDHFMGMFSNRLGELINHLGFEICGVEERAGSEDAPPTAIVTVAVQPAAGKQQQQQHGQQQFEFHLRRKTVGARRGSLMTYTLRRVQQG